MPLLPLHGGAGGWDELLCLVLPATLMMWLALTVARKRQGDDAPADEPAVRDGGEDEPRAPVDLVVPDRRDS